MSDRICEQYGIRGVSHLRCPSTARPHERSFAWYGPQPDPFNTQSRRGYMKAYMNYATMNDKPPSGLIDRARNQTAGAFHRLGLDNINEAFFDFKVDQTVWSLFFEKHPVEYRPLWPWADARHTPKADEKDSDYFRRWLQDRGLATSQKPAAPSSEPPKKAATVPQSGLPKKPAVALQPELPEKAALVPQPGLPQKPAAAPQSESPKKTGAPPPPGHSNQAGPSSASTASKPIELPPLPPMSGSWADEVDETDDERVEIPLRPKPSYAAVTEGSGRGGAPTQSTPTRGGSSAPGSSTRGASAPQGAGAGRGNAPSRGSGTQGTAPSRGGVLSRGGPSRGSPSKRGNPSTRGASTAQAAPRKLSDVEKRWKEEMDGMRKVHKETITINAPTAPVPGPSSTTQPPAPASVATQTAPVQDSGKGKEVVKPQPTTKSPASPVNKEQGNEDVAAPPKAVSQSRAKPTQGLMSSQHALKHRTEGDSGVNVQWKAPAPAVLQRLCPAVGAYVPPGATANLTQTDPRSRAAMWAEVFGDRAPVSPICGHFEVSLPRNMNFEKLVIGNGGDVISKANEMIDQDFVLSWATEKRDGFNTKKLILSFKRGYRPNSPPQQWAMRDCWGKILIWVRELWQARPVPLDVWVRMTGDQLVTIEPEVQADPAGALTRAYENQSVNLETIQDLFTQARIEAVRQLVGLLEANPSVDGGKEALKEWVSGTTLHVPGVFERRERVAIASTVWSLGLLHALRHHAVVFRTSMDE